MIDQAQKEQFASALLAAKRILITLPLNPTVDDFASGLALALSLEEMDKKPAIYSNEAVRLEQAQLFGVERVTNSLGPRNFVITVEGAIDTVERVDYFLDKGNLNIVLPPINPENEVKPERVHFDYSNTRFDLIIALRQSKEELLSKLVTQEQNLYSNTPTVVISNQIGRFRQEDINLINQAALSLSEMIVEILDGLKMGINGDIAYNLFQGILRSTRNFNVATTSATSLEAAAWCLRNGAAKTSLSSGQGPNVQKSPAPQQTREQARPQVQSQPQPAHDNQGSQESQENKKEDWTTPKIYKGSTIH